MKIVDFVINKHSFQAEDLLQRYQNYYATLIIIDKLDSEKDNIVYFVFDDSMHDFKKNRL